VSIIRLVVATALTVLVVIFAMGNAHRVEMGLVFGKPLEIRLIFLLAIAYACGVVTTLFWIAIRNVSRKVAAQKLRDSRDARDRDLRDRDARDRDRDSAPSHRVPEEAEARR
jgi:uncharacterized integral membrane protein